MALPDVSNVQARRRGGRQDRAAVLLRLGDERDRRQRQARADRNRRRPEARTPAPPSTGCPSTRPSCAPPNAPPILRKSDTTLDARLHRPSRWAAASTAAGTCSTPSAKRCFAVPRKPNRTCTPTATNRRPGPRSRPCASTPERCSCRRARWKATRARSPTPRRTAGTCSNDDPVLTGSDVTNPAAELRRRRRGHRRAGRHLRLHLPRPERLPAGDQGNRPPRPGSPASRRQQGSRPSSTSRSCSTAS